jgi:CHAT domain-containing protein
LDGPAATRDSLLTALPDARLFHFAGHAQLAGPSGAASALIVEGGARIQLGDLLALPRLPNVVVLSACEGAATGASTAGDGSSASTMGLTQAFLAAGAHAVVAPSRNIADAEARVFVSALYETVGKSGFASISEAYRRAAIRSLGRDSQSFRLVVQ